MCHLIWRSYVRLLLVVPNRRESNKIFLLPKLRKHIAEFLKWSYLNHLSILMLDYLSRFRVRFLTREFFLSQRILVFEYDKREKEPTFTGISTSDTETCFWRNSLCTPLCWLSPLTDERPSYLAQIICPRETLIFRWRWFSHRL